MRRGGIWIKKRPFQKETVSFIYFNSPLIRRESTSASPNFQKVRHDEGKHAVAQSCQDAHRAGSARVENHIPSRSKGIQNRQSRDAGQRFNRQRFSQPGGNRPVQQRLDEKPNDIAAGGPQHHAQPAAKSGKHRRAHCAQQKISRHGVGSPASAKDRQSHKNGKGLHAPAAIKPVNKAIYVRSRVRSRDAAGVGVGEVITVESLLFDSEAIIPQFPKVVNLFL